MLCSAATASSRSPASFTVSRDAATQTVIMTQIAVIERSGSTRSTATVAPGRTRSRTIRASWLRRIGTTIMLTSDSTIATTSTAMKRPAKTCIKSGVRSGESRVETVVIATERATFAFAR